MLQNLQRPKMAEFIAVCLKLVAITYIHVCHCFSCYCFCLICLIIVIHVWLNLQLM